MGSWSSWRYKQTIAISEASFVLTTWKYYRNAKQGNYNWINSIKQESPVALIIILSLNERTEEQCKALNFCMTFQS
jgi:hypothetical protein